MTDVPAQAGLFMSTQYEMKNISDPKVTLCFEPLLTNSVARPTPLRRTHQTTRVFSEAVSVVLC